MVKDGIFKPAPVCDADLSITENKQRLESLIHVLTDRLVISSQDLLALKSHANKTNIKSFSTSAAAYSTYLSVNFTAKQKVQPNKHSDAQLNSEPDETLSVDLNSLNLTNECLKDFSAGLIVCSDQREQINIKNNLAEIISLNLSRNQFSEPPVQLMTLFTNLEVLDLSENHFDSIYLATLSQLANLKEINLSSNVLKTFKLLTDQEEEEEEKKSDSSTSILFTVERLNLANNKLTSPSSLLIAEFRNLKYLNLSNNDYQLSSTSLELQLPWQRAGSYLKGLLELNFSRNNKLTQQQQRRVNFSVQGSHSAVIKPPPSLNLPYFDALINLRVLDLSENNLYNVPNDIKELRNLENLKLDLNFLEFLPIELTELRKLKKLSVSSNRISELSLTFCSYARFRDSINYINLSHNQIHDETLSYKLALFENLKHLDLSYNLFELMPNPLPPNLEELNMNNNKVKSLMIRPLSVMALNDDDVMQILDLEDKKFRPKVASSQLAKSAENYKEDEFDEENLESASLIEERKKHKQSYAAAKKKKAVFDERIYDEPDIDKLDSIELPHVFYLRNLKRLHLRDNSLSEIPADFGILNSNLEFLDLGFNLLHEIDVSLCRGLAYLKHLDLSSNRIKRLPDKIRELSELELLDLSKNRISEITHELCNDLRNLKELNLSNNSLYHLFISLTQSGKRSTTAMSTSRPTSTHSIGDATATTPVNPDIQYAKFSFNLPLLKKINVSNNRLSGSISLYRCFALSAQLAELDLSSNRLTAIEVDNLEEKESISMAFNQECLFDEEKIQKLSLPKYRLHELSSINLSNNLIDIEVRGDFTKLLCKLYKLAPSLTHVVYDQKNGARLGSFHSDEPAVAEMKLSMPESLVQIPLHQKDDGADYCFELNESDFFMLNTESDTIQDKTALYELLNSKIRNEFYDLLCNNLQSIDLSNNDLKTLPSFVYKLKNLKEIYFNGNLLKKIPNEMFKHLPQLNAAEEEEFENLKRIQKKAEEMRKKLADVDNKEAEEEEIEEKPDAIAIEKTKKKKKKRKDENTNKEPQVDTIAPVQVVKQPDPLISENLEVLQLDNNRIEHVPNNLFARFTKLREIRLNNNPLSNPPQHSVCVSAKLTRNQEFLRQQSLLKAELAANSAMPDSNLTTLSVLIPSYQNNKTRQNSITEMKFLKSGSVVASSNNNGLPASQSSVSFMDKKFNLPNLFFETTENLKPLQSYMHNYKKREGIQISLYITHTHTYNI